MSRHRTHPFRSIVAVELSSRKLPLRTKAIIDIDKYHAITAGHGAAQKFPVVEAADTPPATMIVHTKWTSPSWLGLWTIDPDSDFMAISPDSHQHTWRKEPR